MAGHSRKPLCSSASPASPCRLPRPVLLPPAVSTTPGVGARGQASPWAAGPPLTQAGLTHACLSIPLRKTLTSFSFLVLLLVLSLPGRELACPVELEGCSLRVAPGLPASYSGAGQGREKLGMQRGMCQDCRLWSHIA